MKIKTQIHAAWLSLALVAVTPAAGLAEQSGSLSDAEIRQQIVSQSIASYPGNCPCPYNRASNGSRCGKRSAYSKPGGYAPKCYPRDVSDKEVEMHRQSGVSE